MTDSTTHLILADSTIHVVLDLETMGNTQSAAIVAIGAVACTVERGVFDNFYVEVALSSAVEAGLTMDASTVLWWINQSASARRIFENNMNATSLNDALFEFKRWFNSLGAPEKIQVWGNGADFDNAILRNAFMARGMPDPWRYSNNRCLRTLRGENLDVDKPAFVGIPHNALDDAKNQAAHLLAIKRKALYGANPTGQLKVLS